MTDHDRLFKELLTTFFIDFVNMFLTEIAKDVDPDSIVFLDKEIFTDLTSGEKHVVDLLVKVKIRGTDAFILIHIENQSRPSPQFPVRMFTYFARLHEKYALPVYPVVIFSYSKPLRPEPSTYEVVVSGKSVLQFNYVVIQLNQLSWRRFIDYPNPVATALMTRMQIDKADRPKVKAECLRLLATLRLDPAKSELIGVFIETYLKLTADELKVYEREFAALPPDEKEATMEMITSWHREGRIEGRQEGRAEGELNMLLLFGEQRLGKPAPETRAALTKITSPELLKSLALRISKVESWEELLAD